MAIAANSRTYGLTDLKVAPLTGEAPGTLVDVPGIRSCDVTLATDVDTLRGDGKVISVVDKGNSVEWSMESGGISLDALTVMLGKAPTITGTTPSQIGRTDFKSGDSRPYFYLQGQSKDDAGGDIQVIIWKAKATGNVSLSFADENFLTPGLEGTAVGRTADDLLLTLLYHETAAAVAVLTP
jgi:hypothetical protein